MNASQVFFIPYRMKDFGFLNKVLIINIIFFIYAV